MIPTTPFKGELSNLVRPHGWGGRVLTWPGEIDALIDLARQVRPKTLVEFGICDGHTAWMLLNNVKSITRYVGVDVLPGYTFETNQQNGNGETPLAAAKLVRADPRVTLLISQRGTLDLKVDDLPRADMVFIDADHGENAVRHDTGLARAILNPGGIVVWHDYYTDRETRLGVNDALDDDFRKGRRNLRHIEGTCIVFDWWNGNHEISPPSAGSVVMGTA